MTEDLHQRAADAIRAAACTGNCGQTEEECAKERIQPFVWHHGKLAVVEGSPEMFAGAVLAELKPELDALAALRQVARGYCPDCGRGDAAPTVADWEQQRHRADQAEAERDVAHQQAAAIAAQRDRLRQRMNTLADRWDLEGPPPGNRPLTELRAEISVGPFEPDASLVVQPYRADDGSQKWAFRCWGTDTCDGWLSLDHTSEQSAQRARDRHVAKDHTAPTTAATEATGLARQRDELLVLAREILHGGHITGDRIARWREQLDELTDQTQRPA
ncbi:hypothetical protein [Streptomyces sp. NPDC020298]|uniref:hypothetical protein n=1 Tax=unclassified Streptomyces TaxID=2593676 RepID=UPI0033DAD357